MAGNRIVDDPRNSLYLELIEIVEHLQPDFVICENVKGLRSMLDGLVEKKIIDDFRAIGYKMNKNLFKDLNNSSVLSQAKSGAGKFKLESRPNSWPSEADELRILLRSL